MLMIEEYIKELGEYFEGIERFNKALIVKIILQKMEKLSLLNQIATLKNIIIMEILIM